MGWRVFRIILSPVILVVWAVSGAVWGASVGVHEAAAFIWAGEP